MNDYLICKTDVSVLPDAHNGTAIRAGSSNSRASTAKQPPVASSNLTPTSGRENILPEMPNVIEFLVMSIPKSVNSA